ALRRLGRVVPEAADVSAAEERCDVAQLVPELGPADGVVTEPQRDVESVRSRLFEAANAFLTECAKKQPLALFLDDLHNADAESILLLESIGQTIDRLPIAIVVTCREHEAGRAREHARAMERLLRLTSLERWPLEGLSGEE